METGIMKAKKTMKKTALIILINCTAISASYALSFAQQNKLEVKDANQNTVFAVDDTGTVTGKRLGMGTSTPQASFHMNNPDGNGVYHDVGTVFYPPTTAALISSQDFSTNLTVAVADSTGTPGYRGTIKGLRARGTLANPIPPQKDDVVFTVMGAIWDGNGFQNTAEIGFKVDGPVSDGIGPQRIAFSTSATSSSAKVERLTIGSNGTITISDLAGNYNGGSAYVCVNNSGVIYASESPCP